MEIEIGEKNRLEAYTVEQMVSDGSPVFPAADKVPGVKGMAFDWIVWYRAWREKSPIQIETPTHVHVEASDEYTATIPWLQMESALFLYEQNGKPLVKGYPIRLYVPDGTSACLNLKSVIRLKMLHNAQLGEEASFGFKNQVSPAKLRSRPVKEE